MELPSIEPVSLFFVDGSSVAMELSSTEPVSLLFVEGPSVATEYVDFQDSKS